MLFRRQEDGSLDPSFGTGGVVTLAAGTPNSGLALQADGKILVNTGGITRLNANGSVDTSFGSAGTVTPPLKEVGLVLQPGGMIVAVGSVALPVTSGLLPP